MYSGFRESLRTEGVCSSVEDPPNQLVDESLVSMSLGSKEQIQPQFMKLKLRVGQEQKVKFSVAQRAEHPVDLYYLMDLSNSMADDKENVVRLGEQLAKAIEKITADYTIG